MGLGFRGADSHSAQTRPQAPRDQGPAGQFLGRFEGNTRRGSHPGDMQPGGQKSSLQTEDL